MGKILHKLFKTRMMLIRSPIHQPRGLHISKFQRDLHLFEKHHGKQHPSAQAFSRLVLHPLRLHRCLSPDHHHRFRGIKRFLNNFIKRSADWNTPIPPNRPPLLLEYTSQRLNMSPVFTGVTDENVTHAVGLIVNPGIALICMLSRLVICLDCSVHDSTSSPRTYFVGHHTN